MWYIYLNNNFVEIYFNDPNTKYIRYPAGDLIVDAFLNLSTLNINNITNKPIIEKISAASIAHPLIGTNTFEEYSDKLARYLNGDTTVSF